jgi:hypothetical protein
MKKAAIFFISALAMASCVKETEFTCECNGTDDNGDPATSSTTFYSTEDNADNICNAESITADSTATCEYY